VSEHEQFKSTETRPAALCDLYERVFSGQEDRIPLVVTPTCPPSPSREELVTDTASAVKKAAESAAPKVAAGTDWLPCVCIAWYQNTAVPSVFDAPTAPVEGAFPIARPVFQTIAEAAAAGKPDIDTKTVSEMLRTVETAVQALPEGFSLSFPATVSPLDLALLLLPAEVFLVSLLTEPDAAHAFLSNLTDLCIDVERLVHQRLGSPVSERVTCRGIYFPGFRVPCDAIVNLSPGLIRAFALPMLSRFANAFGKLCLHVCTAPAPAGHVLPALLESDAVAAVDNWQGPEVFLGDDAPSRLQSKIAIITDTDFSGEKDMDAFLDCGAVHDVPRRGGRGLVVHAKTDSVDSAKRLYASWRERAG
jgi:hypothetical protein